MAAELFNPSACFSFHHTSYLHVFFHYATYIYMAHENCDEQNPCFSAVALGQQLNKYLVPELKVLI